MSYTLITKLTPASGWTQLDITNIPQTYRDLVLFISGKNAQTSTILTFVEQDDSNSNYTFIRGQGTSESYNENSLDIGFRFFSTANALRIDFPDYANATDRPVYHWQQPFRVGAFLYETQTAVNDISISSNRTVDAGTQVILYGVE